MKHSIKMIACDLDGTLLKTDKTISERTKTALVKCREAGIKVIFATGRGGSSARVVPAELFDGYITMNGAVTRTRDAVVYSRLIPYEIARPFLVDCDRRGLSIASETGDMHYTNFKIPDEWLDVVKNYEITDFSQHDKDAEKLYTFGLTSEDVLFVEERLPGELYMIAANDDLVMIMHKGATKSKALAELARVWEIAQSEIAAFGDDLNDVDMLEYASVGVAMENAHDEVKAAAGFICRGNDEDGVARWIEEMIL